MNIESRLKKIESRVSVKSLEPFRIGRPADTIEELRGLIQECQQRNVPGCMVWHFVYWNAEPCTEAALLLAEAGFLEVSL